MANAQMELFAPKVSLVPKDLSGKDFESIVEHRLEQYESERKGSFGRYGVKTNFMTNPLTKKLELMPMQSYPDFEGVVRGGRQIIFDCKVCSQSSFNWSYYRSITKGSKHKQLKHMLERSNYGVTCFFLIHWNERVLKTKTVEAATYAVLVRAGHPYWDAVESGEVKSLTPEDCRTTGVEIPWVRPKGKRNAVVDLGVVIKEL
jgi:penicillin-binding protein-related factor A (putative recombinase)